MHSMTLKDMIDFLDHKAAHTGPADPYDDRACLEAIRGRLSEMFRLRGTILNCPDAEDDIATKIMKCLDLKPGS